MTDVPKIVHHRLQAAEPGQYVPGQAHPDANLLVSFAEQALSPAERDDILTHLALCLDCRDVVALALPFEDLAVTPIEHAGEVESRPVQHNARKNWFAWANLHWGQVSWATLAAGIAVALFVVRPMLEHRVTPTAPPNSVARQTAAPISVPQAAPSPTASAPPAPNGNMLVGTLKDSPATATGAPKHTNETIAVPGAATIANTERSAQTSLMARADAPPIRKAKPALDSPSPDSHSAEPSETLRQTPSPAIAAKSQPQTLASATPEIHAMKAMKVPPGLFMATGKNASWTISGGVLQRSLDDGKTWQSALRTDHPLLCYANRGSEVWAGGQSGTLMHSTDGGATWSAVAVFSQGQSLSSDVTRIDLRSTNVRTAETLGPAVIVLTTANQGIWSSASDGKSWEKK
jgi:hypothetical protein